MNHRCAYAVAIACFGAIVALACCTEGYGQTLSAPHGAQAVTDGKDWLRDHMRRAATLPPEKELEELMGLIGETHSAVSWPPDLEGPIQDWVDAGDASAQPPFDDRYGVVTPAFFQRLRDLRQSLGGWLYWNDEQRRVVFAPEAEWRQVRVARDAKRAALMQTHRDAVARAERALALAPGLADEARRDPAVWPALKAWTLRQGAEMKQRARSQTAANKALSGPLAIGFRSMDDRVWHTQLSFEPSFVDFIERRLAGEDNQIKFAIAVHIWTEARTELGLNRESPR